MEIYNEYDAPETMRIAYCEQISAAQFEQQGAEETEKALQDLMDYLEKNPQVYKTVLVRKKQEEAENAGILSYVKCKVLATIRGPDYMQDEVSNEETLNKLGALQHEMGNVYNYTQEANKSKKRFSRRIATRKSKAAKNDENTPRRANFKVPSKASHFKRKTPPPPPPYPPPLTVSSPGASGSDDEVFLKSVLPFTPSRRPPIHPQVSVDCTIPIAPPPPLPVGMAESRVLKEKTNLKEQVSFDSPKYQSTPKPPFTPGVKSSLQRYGSTSSLASITSVHNELLSFNKNKLKSVSKSSKKSPNATAFKTPQSRKRVISASIVRASITDICGISSIDAFNQQMLEKFRNTRSPTTAVHSPASGFNSPTGFTP